MKKTRLILITVLVLMLSASLLAGCSACGSRDAEGDGTFSYSSGIDDQGHWEGITATDIVEMFDYDALKIPSDVSEVTDEEVQSQVESIVSTYATAQVVDRAAEAGDTLNIDYVGTVDGEEFEGGSTEGAGTDVTIGETSYIDDFIDQLVGHSAGESFEVEVTFPEDYDDGTLSGKDAVFNVTVNSVSEAVQPELTDAWVKENLSAEYSWNTIKEMEQGLRDQIQEEALVTYVQEYLVNEVTVTSIPESIIEYQENALVAYYKSYAEMYGVELEEFLTSYVQVESMEALLEESQEEIRNKAVFSLVTQAIAEDAGIEVSDEDLADYFLENMGDADYSTYEEEYGLPYLKQNAMSQMVLDRIVENAVIK